MKGSDIASTKTFVPDLRSSKVARIHPGRSLQNQDDVVSVKASAVRLLDLGDLDVRSHDFH